MITLPAPQRSTVPMVLSARFVVPRNTSGDFDFGSLPRVNMVNVSSGFLYRILGYSFACELPESDYCAAQQTAFPVSFQLWNSGNLTQILSKPVPVPMYQRDAQFLQYFAINETSATVSASLSGVLDGSSVGLVGYADLSAVLSLFVQSIGDSDWLDKYQLGEM